jgi:hypothetical protein
VTRVLGLLLFGGAYKAGYFIFPRRFEAEQWTGRCKRDAMKVGNWEVAEKQDGRLWVFSHATQELPAANMAFLPCSLASCNDVVPGRR